MLDQMQAETIVPSLSTLLKYPAFQAGLYDAPEVYADNDEALSSETTMMVVVERNLTRRARERDRRASQATGTEPPSYLYQLGLVLGLINEGLLLLCAQVPTPHKGGV
ncbi:MAG: hypothetical protein ABI406_12980 [Ktedonobacteraceae bacterium]